ncbi:hypothetical protein [Helicobacter turcicus]|uniref:Uncharacterized protein n=1 Tax=Helicobacter turcicus TaxID=2867412 RepID=A0ABS7JKI3_9HELI|nr:hypothetical protein [Helicobacter turcicus]MBX7489909.1 hypothetical protein [Helicobacter turcicus]MBX7544769.1 hypothetical protein [Helicobacter turcicus]
MFLRFYLTMFLCFLCTANAYTLKEYNGVRISKTLSGDALQKVLEQVKQTTKGKEQEKIKAILPIDNFTFNDQTDMLLEVTDSSGQLLYYLAAPKDKTDFCRVEPLIDSEGEKTYQWTSYKTAEGATIALADTYGRNFPASGGGDPRVAINSAGMWIYATSYADFANKIIFTRNEWDRNAQGGKRDDYFHVLFNADGTLQITSKITDYSVDRLQTLQPYPLNQWVYIQAYQEGNNYTIGWKTADKTEHVVGPKTFTRQADITADTFKTFMQNYQEENDCVMVREFFWQPGVNMFEIMNNYNAVFKEIEQVQHKVFRLDTIFINEINKAIIGQPSSLTLNDFNVYVDNNYVIYVVDIRKF